MTKPSRVAPLILLILLVSGVAAQGGERDAIIKDVHLIAAPGLPGTVCVIGAQAFVVVDGATDGKVAGLRQGVIAATRHGKGSVVLFGHDGYFNPGALKEGDTTPLLVNLIRWAAREIAKPRVGVVDSPQLAEYLTGQGIDATTLARGEWAAKLADYAVVFFPLSTPKDAGDAAAIRRYVEGGGAAFLAGTGWGWLQTHPGLTLAEHPLNQMLAEIGLALGDG